MRLSHKKEALIRELISQGYLRTPRIIKAFREIPREGFLGGFWRDYAYKDTPLEIGSGQTISAPHMVAIMTESLNPGKRDRILEIGSGSGYQAAILSRLARKVYSVELEGKLAGFAKENLERAGLENVEVIQGDGSEGLPDKAPFDRIIVTCGSDRVYPAWKDQIRERGIILVPVDKGNHQVLKTIRKKSGKFTESDGTECVFVPLRH